jgi:hypothetical protein
MNPKIINLGITLLINRIGFKMAQRKTHKHQSTTFFVTV